MLAKGDDIDAVLEALSKGLTAKFMHGPQQALHRAQGEERAQLANCCRNVPQPPLAHRCATSASGATCAVRLTPNRYETIHAGQARSTGKPPGRTR
jgi:hypothetical protein